MAGLGIGGEWSAWEELDERDLAGAMGLYIAGTSVGGLTGRLIPAFMEPRSTLEDAFPGLPLGREPTCRPDRFRQLG